MVRRSPGLTGRLGLMLGVAFGICFLTGLLSHAIQHPPGWFHWPSRPVQLYRITQGVHVATGLACFPLLTAKVWSVYPKLFARPPVRGVLHGLERLSIALLSGAAIFELVTGLLNIAYWYGAMPFGFIGAHYWTAWLAIGALLLHIAVKLPLARVPANHKADKAGRRTVHAQAATAAGVITLAFLGQTVRPLRRVSLLAPRLPDVGPQGLPVNKTAASAGVTRVDDGYRLMINGPQAKHALTLADLERLPQYTVSLPISCVEGWSAGAQWTGVRVADLVKLVGGAGRVRVDSLQRNPGYGSSILEPGQARDPLTLLALRVGGEPLHLDHGYPCRLIAPNRPGALQTKWVSGLTVMST